jgi:periplasmic divalent cation tolerance protein
MMNQQPDDLLVLMVTTPDEETAREIARSLVEGKLAACVNLLPGMKSIYRWDGEIQEEPEVLLLIKTKVDLFKTQLVLQIQKLHPYDVPEIIALPITAGEHTYLNWIRAETAAD